MYSGEQKPHKHEKLVSPGRIAKQTGYARFPCRRIVVIVVQDGLPSPRFSQARGGGHQPAVRRLPALARPQQGELLEGLGRGGPHRRHNGSHKRG